MSSSWDVSLLPSLVRIWTWTGTYAIISSGLQAFSLRLELYRLPFWAPTH